MDGFHVGKGEIHPYLILWNSIFTLGSNLIPIPHTKLGCIAGLQFLLYQLVRWGKSMNVIARDISWYYEPGFQQLQDSFGKMSFENIPN